MDSRITICLCIRLININAQSATHTLKVYPCLIRIKRLKIMSTEQVASRPHVQRIRVGLFIEVTFFVCCHFSLCNKDEKTQVFNNFIKDCLHGRTRVPVADQLHFLHLMDKIILVSDGMIREGSTFEELLKNGKLFRKLMENEGKIEDCVYENGDQSALDRMLSKPAAGEILIELPKDANSTAEKKESKSVLVKQEKWETGIVSLQVLMRFKSALGGLWVVMILFMCYTLPEVLRVMSSTWLSGQPKHGSSKSYKVSFHLQNRRAENQVTFASSMGLILRYLLNIRSLLSKNKRRASGAENSLNSLECAGSYIIELPFEGPLISECSCHPPGWPSSGLIQFEDVVVHYSPGLRPVLRGLSFTIHPRDKVKIVEGTGSGKSSKLNALFCIVEIDRGRILYNIAKFGLIDLLKILSIIQQSPSLFSGDEGMIEIKQQPNGQVLSEHDMALPLVTVPASEYSKEKGVMWASSPDRLELLRKPFHCSDCSNSPCVSESGSDIFSKREVIQKLRQQLKRRDDMILKMQDQIVELQNSLSAQLSHSTHLQSLLDAANRDLFDSEREMLRLRKAIADHCVRQVDPVEMPPAVTVWRSEGRNGHANGFPDDQASLESPVKARGNCDKIELLKREVEELKEVIEGK